MHRRNFGADDEVRTRDLKIGNLLLYQLSYIRKPSGFRGLIWHLSLQTGSRSRKFGSRTRARTWDIRINSPLFYQLNYTGTITVFQKAL